MLKKSGVTFLSEDLREDLIQLDDPCDEPHFQPVVEDLVFIIVGVERIANYTLEIGCELSQIGSLGLLVAPRNAHSLRFLTALGKSLGDFY